MSEDKALRNCHRFPFPDGCSQGRKGPPPGVSKTPKVEGFGGGGIGEWEWSAGRGPIERATKQSECGGRCQGERWVLLSSSALRGAQGALRTQLEYQKLGLNPLGD